MAGKKKTRKYDGWQYAVLLFFPFPVPDITVLMLPHRSLAVHGEEELQKNRGKHEGDIDQERVLHPQSQQHNNSTL